MIKVSKPLITQGRAACPLPRYPSSRHLDPVSLPELSADRDRCVTLAGLLDLAPDQAGLLQLLQPV